MLSDIKEVADRMESLTYYIEANRERFISIEDAFLAGYRKALDDTIEMMRNLKIS